MNGPTEGAATAQPYIARGEADLLEHLQRVKKQHASDLQAGYGFASLPYAPSRKYLNAATEWNWQFIFPAPADRKLLNPTTACSWNLPAYRAQVQSRDAYTTKCIALTSILKWSKLPPSIESQRR